MTVCFPFGKTDRIARISRIRRRLHLSARVKSYDSFDIKTAPMVKGEVDIIAVNEGSPEASELRGYTNGQFYQERKIAKYPAVFSKSGGRDLCDSEPRPTFTHQPCP